MELDMSDECLQLEFEGVEAQDSDLSSMTMLLNQLVKESEVDAEQLAKLLIAQNYVGSVLKPCLEEIDDEDMDNQPVFAITSMVNLTAKKHPATKDVINFLRKRIQDSRIEVKKVSDAFDDFIHNEGTPSDLCLGLLIKERMINMPIQLLYPSLQSLVSDVETALEKQMPYKFTHLIYISKMYIHEGNQIHIDEEDDWFDDNSTAYFSYVLENSDTVMVKEGDTSGGGVPIRRVYIIPYPKLESFINHVKDVTGQ